MVAVEIRPPPARTKIGALACYDLMTVLASGVVMATCKQCMYACTIARYYIKLGSCIRRILVLTYKLSFALKRTYALKTQPRPRLVCAIWVSRGSKPSAIANFRDKLDRWRHIQNRWRWLGTRLLKTNLIISPHFASRDRYVGFMSCMTLTNLAVAIPTKT